MDVDYRIKANSTTYRDGNVDAGKIPAAGDQPAVEALLTVHRDSYFDVGERRRPRHQAAVEMLHLVTTHLEIKGELLLERELAADFVRATSGSGGVASASRHEPVHVRDRVGVKQ